MITITHGRKTFPRQPKWNSGGALGALAGLLVSPAIPVDLFASRWFAAHEPAVVANVIVCAIAGACIGMIIGMIADHRDRRPTY